MPKKQVTSHVYEIESPNGMVRVGVALSDPNSVAIHQKDQVVLLDLHAWNALHDLQKFVVPKRKRATPQKRGKTE
jgi:hypothetical protein